MRYRCVRAFLVACLALAFIAGCPAQQSSAEAGNAPLTPRLTLTAEGHDAPHTLLADLHESVSFKATWTGTLHKGEYLAILSGRTLIGKPCAHVKCSGPDSY